MGIQINITYRSKIKKIKQYSACNSEYQAGKYWSFDLSKLKDKASLIINQSVTKLKKDYVDELKLKVKKREDSRNKIIEFELSNENDVEKG